MIFKPTKLVYLNQNYKSCLWNLTDKWKLFIMSTCLDGWHIPEWVKKDLHWKCLVLCYILAQTLYLSPGFTNVSTIPNSKFTIPNSPQFHKFCSQFNLVADILTLIKHASCLNIQGLYFLNIFIHWRYYLSLLIKL